MALTILAFSTSFEFWLSLGAMKTKCLCIVFLRWYEINKLFKKKYIHIVSDHIFLVEIS